MRYLSINQDQKDDKNKVRTPPPPCYSRAAPPIPNNPTQLQRKFLTPPPPPKPGKPRSSLGMSTHSLPDYGLTGMEYPIKPPVAPMRKDSLSKDRHIGGNCEAESGNRFEEYFLCRFKHSSLFPAPDVFSNCEKTFPSVSRTTHAKEAKQAPGFKLAVSAVRKPAPTVTKSEKVTAKNTSTNSNPTSKYYYQNLNENF